MDLISRQAVIDMLATMQGLCGSKAALVQNSKIWQQIKDLPSAEPVIIRCKDCKHNPSITWFECPMSHLSESQRPETAWCWKAERRTDG